MTHASLLSPPWTDAEDATVRAHYGAGGAAGVQALLPHRSIASIHHRARRVDSLRRRRWSAADDDRLRRLWTGDSPLPEIARILKRTPRTTYWRAQKLKLPLGVPPGFEYLHAAAKRTGFGTGQLRRILAAARVSVRRVLARPSEPRGKRGGARNTCGMVWPSDVDIAVADWLQRETVEQLAKRHGVARETLSKRLRALGGKRPRGKKHWRVTDEEAARALSARLVRTRERGRYSGAHYAEGAA